MIRFSLELFAFLFLLHVQNYQEALTKAQQCVCTVSTSNCIQGVCRDTEPFPLVCEIEVVLTLDNSVSHVGYFCTNDLFAQCNIHPSITNTSTGSVHYACCDDKDNCNRCLIPETLPYEAKLLVPLDPDCNVTITPPSQEPPPPSSFSTTTATTTISPTDNNTTRSSSKSYYTYGTIVVGTVTLVCLIAVPLLVLTVWCRQRHVLSRNQVSISCGDYTHDHEMNYSVVQPITAAVSSEAKVVSS